MKRILLIAALSVLACSSRKQPSAAYSEARAQFATLYAKKLDDAYLDPRMDEIVRLLKTVLPDSLDAAPAHDLLKQIEDNRKRIQDDQAALARATAEASAPAAPFVSRATPDSTPPVIQDAGAVVDAGAPFPVVDMPISELQSRFSRCFVQGETFHVKDEGMRTRWTLFDVANCRDLFPDFTDRVVLTDDTKIWRIVRTSAIQQVKIQADGGTAQAAPPDAGS